MTSIRKATPEDRSALELCFVELQRFERAIEPNRTEPSTIAAEYIEELVADCVDHDGVILIAEEDDHVVGFACVLSHVRSSNVIEKHRDHAYVTDLYVRASERPRNRRSIDAGGGGTRGQEWHVTNPCGRAGSERRCSWTLWQAGIPRLRDRAGEGPRSYARLERPVLLVPLRE